MISYNTILYTHAASALLDNASQFKINELMAIFFFYIYEIII